MARRGPPPGERPTFSEEWLVAVLDSLEEAVLALDDDGRLIACNPAAEDLLGFAVNEVRGWHFLELAPDLRRPDGTPFEDDHPVVATIRDGRARVDVTASLPGEADGRDVRVNTSRLPAIAAGERGGVVVSLVDITELVRAETALRDQTAELASAYTQLQQLEELKGDLISKTSHELRTPVATILGYIELLTDHWEVLSEEERREHVEDVGVAADELSRRLGDLIVAAQLTGGMVTAHPEVICAAELIADAVRRVPDAGDVRVEVPSGVDVELDPDHGRRMIGHLVENAVKYGRPPVGVRLRRLGPGVVEIAVTDRGAGVDPGLVPRLFEAFTQGSTGTSREVSGTGLGLAIVRGLAELNDGEIRYEPNAPSGARFVLQLPTP